MEGVGTRVIVPKSIYIVKYTIFEQQYDISKITFLHTHPPHKYS